LALEDFTDAHVKGGGNAEGQFERWSVLASFKGNDGLSGAAYLLSQVKLSHLVSEEAQPADVIDDW